MDNVPLNNTLPTKERLVPPISSTDKPVSRITVALPDGSSKNYVIRKKGQICEFTARSAQKVATMIQQLLNKWHTPPKFCKFEAKKLGVTDDPTNLIVKDAEGTDVTKTKKDQRLATLQMMQRIFDKAIPNRAPSPTVSQTSKTSSPPPRSRPAALEVLRLPPQNDDNDEHKNIRRQPRTKKMDSSDEDTL